MNGGPDPGTDHARFPSHRTMGLYTIRQVSILDRVMANNEWLLTSSAPGIDPGCLCP